MSLQDNIRQGLESLDVRLTELRDVSDSQAALVIALAELDVCREELRVAAEELGRGDRTAIAGIDSLPVAALRTDEGGVVRGANPAAGRLLGTAWSRLVGKPLASLVEQRDRRMLRSEIARLADGRTPTRLQVRLVPRGSEPIDVLAYGSVDSASGPQAAGPEAAALPASGAAGNGAAAALAHHGQRLVSEPARPAPAAGAVAGAASAGGRAVEPARAAAPLVWLLLPAAAPARPPGDPWPALAAMSDMVRLCSAGAPGDEHARNLVEAVGRGVTGCSGVALVRRDASARTAQPVHRAVATAGDGARLAARQLALRSGPLVQAALTGRSCTTEDLAADDRWPGLAGGAVVALPVAGEEGAAVALFAPPYGLGEEAMWLAEMLADTLGSLLRWERDTERLQQESRSLVEALRSRPDIDTAKGIVMARRRCSPDEAFQVLVEVSQTSHVKVRDLATQLVDAVARGDETFTGAPPRRAGTTRRTTSAGRPTAPGARTAQPG